jgi:hypothetical protein
MAAASCGSESEAGKPANGEAGSAVGGAGSAATGGAGAGNQPGTGGGGGNVPAGAGQGGMGQAGSAQAGAGPGPDAGVTSEGGSIDAGSGGKPGPGNTGVPAGTKLTPSGSISLTKQGQMVDSLDITGCVEVHAANVVITKTRIRCTDYYPVRMFPGASLTIEDSEIAASGGSATSGIAFGDYTARRINVHGAADGLKSDNNVLVEDSWIHDNWLGVGDHADGVQSTGGSNVVYRHNFIDVVDHGSGHGGGPNACFQVGNENGIVSTFVIDGNWLYGGGWVINFGGGGTGNRIVNNRFGRGKAEVAGQSKYPDYGPIADRDGKTEISGNVWDDTGQPAK